MLCPSCGMKNSDQAAQCTACGYKFRFGHAFNDPAQMKFINVSKSDPKKSKSLRIFFVAFCFLIFILIIFSWIKSI